MVLLTTPPPPSSSSTSPPTNLTSQPACSSNDRQSASSASSLQRAHTSSDAEAQGGWGPLSNSRSVSHQSHAAQQVHTAEQARAAGQSLAAEQVQRRESHSGGRFEVISSPSALPAAGVGLSACAGPAAALPATGGASSCGVSHHAFGGSAVPAVGEVALVTPTLGASQSLLNKDHFKVMPV